MWEVGRRVREGEEREEERGGRKEGRKWGYNCFLQPKVLKFSIVSKHSKKLNFSPPFEGAKF